MDENGDGEDLTPFWLQNTTNTRRTDRLRRRASSIFFSSGVLLFLLLVISVFFLVFVLPSTLSFSTQIFRPNNVKKSWDSLNIVLVLVAVVFGFLSRIKNEDKYDELQSSPITQNEEAHKPKSSNADQWYNFNTIETQKPSTSYSNPDQWYQDQQLDNKDPFLKRNSSSYPDLREFSSNRYDYSDYTRIFNDDLNLDSSRVLDSVNHHHRRHRSVSEIESFETIPKKTKTIIIDTFVSRSEKPTVSTPPPENQETERVVRRKERVNTKQKKQSEPINPFTELKPHLTPTPEKSTVLPVPVTDLPEFQEMSNFDYHNIRRNKARPSRKVHTPPPPPPVTPPTEKSSNKKSATKDFLNSLYQKKKKKPRQKSVENLDFLIHQSQDPITAQYTPPPETVAPPPPPTPQPTAFQNLFLSKKQKRKRTISVTFPPPPPPPPPPRTPSKPPTTRKMKLEENSNSGGESPLSRIPPPPPPPPPAYFKNPAWKFVVQGDYVRVNSSNSSRSGSPDIDDVESDVTPLSDECGLLTPFHPSPAFCQSPDVNSKAESFITSFRAKLKLEKAHSMNGRQLGLSGLGRGSGPRRIG